MKLKIRSVAFVLASVIALGMVLAAPQATAAPPPSGETTVVEFLSFFAPGDTFVYEVTAAQGAGVLTVETLDCCIPNDLWTVQLAHARPQGNDRAEGTGDGNISTFTGSATVGGWSSGTVVVSYASGVDLFPAGMTVRFTFTSNGDGKAIGNTGMTVSQLP